MATSSITKNFVVSGQKQAEVFANAIEESANSINTPIIVSVNKVRDTEELRKLMVKRKKTNASH